jgi:hypothetical protein
MSRGFFISGARVRNWSPYCLSVLLALCVLSAAAYLLLVYHVTRAF